MDEVQGGQPPVGLAADPMPIASTIVVADVHLEASIAAQHVAQQCVVAFAGSPHEDVQVGEIDGVRHARLEHPPVLVPRRYEQRGTLGWVLSLDANRALEEVGATAGVLDDLCQRGLGSATGMGRVGRRLKALADAGGLLEPV
jgi:hypothetical protein